MAAVIIIAIIGFLFFTGYRFMEKLDGFLSTSACMQEGKSWIGKITAFRYP